MFSLDAPEDSSTRPPAAPVLVDVPLPTNTKPDAPDDVVPVLNSILPDVPLEVSTFADTMAMEPDALAAEFPVMILMAPVVLEAPV